MAFSVEQDVAPNPMDVGLFGAVRVMLDAKAVADRVKKLWRAAVLVDCRLFRVWGKLGPYAEARGWRAAVYERMYTIRPGAVKRSYPTFMWIRGSYPHNLCLIIS
jgi:hypothetical protein